MATATLPQSDTLASRAEWLLEVIFKGNPTAMSRCLKVGPSVVRSVIRGRERDHERDQFLRGCKHYKGINGRWVETGEGQANRVAGVESEAEGEPDPEADGVGERARLLLKEAWCNHIGNASVATKVEREKLAAIRDGDEPDDDVILALLEADLPARVSDDWLLAGEGPMYRETPQEPAGAIPAPEPPKVPADPFGAFLGAVERLQKAEADMAEATRRINEAKAAVDSDKAARMRLTSQVSELAKTLDGRIAQAVREAVAAAVPSSASIAAEAERSVSAKLDAKLEAILTKFGAITREQEDIRRSSSALKTIVETVAQVLKDRSDDTVKCLGDLSEAVTGLEGRREALEARLATMPGGDDRRAIAARLAALEARGVTASPAIRPIREADLDPGETMDSSVWFKLEGTHREVMSTNGIRKTMGQRLGNLYAATLGVEAEGRYKVGDMRLYASWLAQAGESPTFASFAAYYHQHRAGA